MAERDPIDRQDPPLYRQLMALRPPELSPASWARRAGVSSSFFQDVRKGANPRSDNLEKVVAAIGMTMAEFHANAGPVMTEVRAAGVADPARNWRGPDLLARLPFYGSAVGGEYGSLDDHVELIELNLTDVLDHLPRPASVGQDRNAYVLEIVGDSMVPRFKPRERVTVSPRASIGIGDDVIVQLCSPEGDDERIRMVLIKELVRRTATHIVLRQHNPPVEFQIPKEQVKAMHRVLGHYY